MGDDIYEIAVRVIHLNTKRCNLNGLERKLSGVEDVEIDTIYPKYRIIKYKGRIIATAYETKLVKGNLNKFPENEHPYIEKIWEKIAALYVRPKCTSLAKP